MVNLTGTWEGKIERQARINFRMIYFIKTLANKNK